MAKAQKGEALPGLDELMRGPREEPKPRPKAGPTISDEELLGPLPQPGEAPRPQAVKVRAKAGTAPGAKKGPAAKKKAKAGSVRRFFAGFKPFVIPQDPAERLRYKLRWLGLGRYIILPIVATVVSALVLTYLWYLFWYYNDYLMVFSRHVPTIVLLLPCSIGLALAVYIPVNSLLLNRYEARWNRTLRDLLREKVPAKAPTASKAAGPDAKEATKGPQAPEQPLPQPTVNP